MVSEEWPQKEEEKKFVLGKESFWVAREPTRASLSSLVGPRASQTRPLFIKKGKK